MINIPSHLLQVPVAPQMNMADALRQQVGSLSQYVQQQQAKKQMFQQMMQKAMIEQRMKQADPMNQILEKAKIAEAAKILGDEALFNKVRGVPSNAIDVEGRVVDDGQATINRGANIKPSFGVGGVVIPEYEFNEFGKMKPKKAIDLDVKKTEKQIEEKEKLKGTIAKELQKKQSSFNQALSMFKGIIAQTKGAGEEQGGLGLGPGTKGLLAEKLKRPGFGRVSSAYGQRVETATRLNSILTGQNRVIRSVMNMIMQSLPDRFDPQDMVASKIAQSVANAYKVTKAFEKSGLTPEVLKDMDQKALDSIDAQQLVAQFDLTSKEQAELEKITQNILSTPAAKARSLPGNMFNGKSNVNKLKKLGLDPNKFEIIGVQ